MGLTVITGNGKGKTTSALGLALLTVDEGHQGAVVQFLKGNSYAGELFAAQRAGLRIFQFGWGCPWSSLIRNGEMKCRSCGECFRENRKPEHGFALKAWSFTVKLAASGQYKLLVLDEISHALRRGLLEEEKVSELLEQYRKKIDFIVTGRHMVAKIVDLADAVYILNEQKHPFRQGIPSRRGIEY